MNTNQENKIGINIQKYRSIKGWTQDELADAVYSTKSTISKWENGGIIPSVAVLKIVAKALNVPLYKLLSETTPLAPKIINILGRIFLYCFVWVHIDVTIAGLLIALGIGFGVMGMFAGVGAFISGMVMMSIKTGFTPYLIAYTILYLISAPFIFTIIGAGALLLYAAGRTILIFSLKYFWHYPKATYEFIEFNWVRKITKKQWTIFFISIGIGILCIIVFLSIVAINGAWSEIDSF